MNTPNLDKMVSGIKSLATPLQDLILHEAMSDRDYADKAAADLTAMQVRIEKATALIEKWWSEADPKGENPYDNEANIAYDVLLKCSNELQNALKGDK